MLLLLLLVLERGLRCMLVVRRRACPVFTETILEQGLAEETMRKLAEKEGIFCGVSSGGSVAGALQVSNEVENATIVAIICDRGGFDSFQLIPQSIKATQIRLIFHFLL